MPDLPSLAVLDFEVLQIAHPEIVAPHSECATSN
jgi:hypothetical protein